MSIISSHDFQGNISGAWGCSEIACGKDLSLSLTEIAVCAYALFNEVSSVGEAWDVGAMYNAIRLRGL